MLKGAMGKRLGYITSGFLRIVSGLVLLITYIVVKIVMHPQNLTLNTCLVYFLVGTILSGIFNIILCGFTATAYRGYTWIQILCFVVTLPTGGLLSTILTGVSAFSKVSDDEIKNENIFNTKKFNSKELDNDKIKK